MLEAAVQRLVTYWEDNADACANARFLDLAESVSEGGEKEVWLRRHG